ncbi:hypothetical protein LR48_Vigan02g223500 [Vigna angularis]|uniref:Uncharacterized protein n=2 Tax=Phaseolus angularis TaxID=3914 RepID=A0A0L9TZW6_PHAAN|nr:uncharacterized protein HKW66_Vig0194970 [Vigna angularis]KOM36085.1 hypothetical protein LR48_Vigan02g223500 [Vigna angularis]BAT94092.1 hypothetical protein VIGAN_08066300 [Vigna angularis var. angularis]
MGNKYVALLLVCLVVGVCVEAFPWGDEERKECARLCVESCIFPAKFCNWWCTAGCEKPFIASMDDDASKKYPVPTDASYKAYQAAHPEESSKTE